MSKHRILIAEDSKTQSVKLQFLLEKNNYHVLIAYNGREALSVIKKHKVDLIISDIIMPEMNGFELCQKLKSDEMLKSIPVILLTTLDKIVDVLRGLSVGADNYISKPYSDNYLLHRIDSVLNKNDNIIFNEREQKIDINFITEKFSIDPNPQKILNFFISTYEAAVLINRNLQQTQDQLEALNNKLEMLVRERTSELENEIAEHKSTLKELQKALQKAQKLDLLKTEFMHNLSHEIRTPMNAIVGFTELLNDSDSINQDLIEFLPHIKTSLFDLLHIINNMLEAAEYMTDNVELIQKECLVEELLDDLLTSSNKELKQLEKQNITISSSIDEALKNKWINTYWSKTKLVLEKLLSNAIKFTEEGKIEFGVEYKNNDTLKFHIKDTGIGIDKEDIDKIFETFKQLESKHKIKYKGTGVGLAVSKKLVELMGGEIWLKSTPGKGSSFYFTVPVLGKMKEGKTPVASRNKVGSQLTGITILLAEDIDANHFFIKTIAEKHGMNLIWAKNGKQAIELYEKNKNIIDLVLMDLHMPIIDGYEATLKIKEKYPEAIILALSSYTNDLEVIDYETKGFNALIKKPVSPIKLIEIIKKQIAITNSTT